MLFSAGMGMGFHVDLTTSVGWWAILLILNPFIGFGVRHLFRHWFDEPRNLAALAVVMLAIVVIHVGQSLYIDG
jgi:hypothetical protein